MKKLLIFILTISPLLCFSQHRISFTDCYNIYTVCVDTDTITQEYMYNVMVIKDEKVFSMSAVLDDDTVILYIPEDAEKLYLTLETQDTVLFNEGVNWPPESFH